MKSFLYEIPAEYMGIYRTTIPYRIKVRYDGNAVISYEIAPGLATMAIAWGLINIQIQEEVDRLWKEALSSVDITPADHCEHSDLVQDI